MLIKYWSNAVLMVSRTANSTNMKIPAHNVVNTTHTCAIAKSKCIHWEPNGVWRQVSP